MSTIYLIRFDRSRSEKHNPLLLKSDNQRAIDLGYSHTSNYLYLHPDISALNSISYSVKEPLDQDCIETAESNILFSQRFLDLLQSHNINIQYLPALVGSKFQQRQMYMIRFSDDCEPIDWDRSTFTYMKSELYLRGNFECDALVFKSSSNPSLIFSQNFSKMKLRLWAFRELDFSLLQNSLSKHFRKEII